MTGEGQAGAEVVNDTSLEVSCAAVEALVGAVLSKEAAEGAVTVAFVGVEAMAELNGRYRGKEGPTDVLSFSAETAGEGWPEVGEEEASLGDVIVCPEVAAVNAGEYGTSLDSELRRLVVHGVLHLLGYDHESDEGAMQQREEVLLRAGEGRPQFSLVDAGAE